MNKKIKFFLLFSLLFTARCIDTPKDPVLPSWDVRLNIPLLNKTISMKEILDTSSSTQLGIGTIDSIDAGDSLYFILIRKIKKSTGIKDSLKISFSLL